MHASVSLHIDAEPAVVWGLVSDITNMGRWSPEVFEAEWLNDATGPEVGARYRGHVKRNEIGPTYWTECEITECVPGEVFEFAVVFGDKRVNTWRYEFAPAPDGGTTATESFHLDASAHGAVPFDVDSERDATQRSRPIPGRPTGGALPTSTIPRSNPNVESRSLEPAPSRHSGTHETVGRGQAAVPLRDVPDQPVTTLPNPRCRRRCRMEARKRQRGPSGFLRKGP